MREKLKVLSVFGTRPEAIKMAPVVKELTERPERVSAKVCVTAQHRSMLDQVLSFFDIKPDYDLNIMLDNQSLTDITVNVLTRLEEVLDNERPDWILVQGDTTTAMAASLAAFYRRIRIGHVEAGLRTWNRSQPFPEEINRKVADAVADMHFAPSEMSKSNLLREGIAEESILVTGNTVIDALLWAAKRPCPADVKRLLKKIGINPNKEDSSRKSKMLEGNVDLRERPFENRLVLVTAHRRENFGKPLENICRALMDIVQLFPEVHILYPVHPNRNVQDPVYRMLGRVNNITLLPPLDYLSFVHLMKHSYLILTDSGGLQEEAPSLGVPVLVLRELTERPEAVEAGTVRIVGTRRETIVDGVQRLLEEREEYEGMAKAVNPYGDGMASERVIEAIISYDLGRQ